MYSGLSVIAIVPVFNEAAKIGEVVARMPRLRIHFLTHRAKAFLRVSVISALALNWTYLLLHWRNF